MHKRAIHIAQHTTLNIVALILCQHYYLGASIEIENEEWQQQQQQQQAILIVTLASRLPEASLIVHCMCSSAQSRSFACVGL